MNTTTSSNENDGIFKKIGWVLIILFILIVVGAVLSLNWFQIGINPELVENWNDILIKYLFIIVVCERSAAAIMDIRFQRSITELKKKVNNWQSKIDLKINALQPAKAEDDESTTVSATAQDNIDVDGNSKEGSGRKLPNAEEWDEIYNMMDKKEVRQMELEEAQGERRMVNMRFLIVVGILISIAGLSVMNDLVIYPDAWGDDGYGVQRWLMRFMDILLTGALIGGGSKGFYELFDTIQSFLDRTKAQNEARS